ncbi:MAG: hypothetical protein QGI45_13980 [Myxococcota bacterium]|nr:hypothetical protein [Myxococcota bacterium]
METTLHRQLKDLYANENSQQEVQMGKYRIDLVRDDVLVEIQLGSLAAIRDKIQTLIKSHRVLLVKPIVDRKHLIKLKSRGGDIISRRRSPKRANIMSLFDELVYCTKIFPHPNLCIDVPFIEIEELRFAGQGRKRWRRKNSFQIEDQKLIGITGVQRFSSGADLRKLIPKKLPSTFHTGDLAQAIGEPRKTAQQMAYCFARMNISEQIGKEGNTLLYRFKNTRQKKNMRVFEEIWPVKPQLLYTQSTSVHI